MKLKTTIAAIIFSCVLLTGCNYNAIDVNYQFDYAIIKLQNGEVVEGKVDGWRDYEGEQLQVVVDGVLYLTNSYNCTLIRH